MSAGLHLLDDAVLPLEKSLSETNQEHKTIAESTHRALFSVALTCLLPHSVQPARSLTDLCALLFPIPAAPYRLIVAHAACRDARSGGRMDAWMDGTIDGWMGFKHRKRLSSCRFCSCACSPSACLGCNSTAAWCRQIRTASSTRK